MWWCWPQEIRPRAVEYDRLAQYTRVLLAALRESRPWASRAPREHGGLGADLVTVYLISEEIAKKCPSTAIGYKMRLEATELLFPLTSTIQNLTGKETLPCPIFACCSHLLSL